MNRRHLSIPICRTGVISGVLLLSVALFSALWKSQPVYQGRALSFWLNELKSQPGQREYLRAKAALVHLSDAAAPRVARLLNYRESKLLTVIRSKAPPAAARILTPKLDARMIRARGFDVLREMGTNASPAVPALVHLLESPDSITRGEAIRGLGYIGPNARMAVASLIALLEKDSKENKMETAPTLGAIGPAARPAVPFLVSSMKKNELPTIVAVRALVRIGYSPKEAVPLLIAQLRADTNSFARSATASCLGLIGADAAPAVPALIDALRDPESRTRAHIALALGQIGPDASGAVPVLTQLLNDEWWYVRQNSAAALGKIGRDGNPALPMLAILEQHDPNEDVRNAAAEAIGLIRSDSKESSGR